MQRDYYEWRSSQSALPEGAKVYNEDWCFIDDKGDYHARLYFVGDCEMAGSWCWRVWINYKLHKGFALSKTDAKLLCERLLLKNGVIDMNFNRNMYPNV